MVTMAGRIPRYSVLRRLADCCNGQGQGQNAGIVLCSRQRQSPSVAFCSRRLHSRPTTRVSIPTVTQKTGFGWARVDVFSRLLQDRILCVMGPVGCLVPFFPAVRALNCALRLFQWCSGILVCQCAGVPVFPWPHMHL